MQYLDIKVFFTAVLHLEKESYYIIFFKFESADI